MAKSKQQYPERNGKKWSHCYQNDPTKCAVHYHSDLNGLNVNLEGLKQNNPELFNILTTDNNPMDVFDTVTPEGTHVSVIASPEAFQQAIEDNLIFRTRHPEYPYSIYKYSQACTYSASWNEVTTASRGLIIHDETGEIIARPFPKFFNYSEGKTPAELMVGDIHVTEKLDGCFQSEARLNLWDGGVITIGEVVKNKLSPVLIGMDENGSLVPTRIVNWFDNGRKPHWLKISLDSPTSMFSGNKANMIVTPNHHLFINGDYIPAAQAKVGDVMIGQQRNLSDNLVHFIKASMLGDGCVTWSGKNAKYQESHSVKQKEYVEYMRDILGDAKQSRKNTTSGYGSELHWVGSKEYYELNKIREEWYPEDTKVIPQDLSWMDDFAVAKWFMDDGSLAHNGQKYQQDRALFSTNGFIKEDVERLGEKLKEMYGVAYTVYNSKGWNLRINAGYDSAIDTMWEAIAPHIHPSLRYKLPVKYRSVKFVPYSQGYEFKETKEVRITAVEIIPPKNPDRVIGFAAYDIGTETENYMINGVIVHNSLGISFINPQGDLEITTAGGFQAEQATHATEIYNERYKGNWEPRKGYTYLWEIIYPENRIVVDYGDEDDIYLLGAVEIATGKSIPVDELSEWKWKKAKTYDGFESMEAVVNAPEKSNAEGYIVHFKESNTRVKLKFSEYLEIHKIATGLSEFSLHNLLATGGREKIEEYRSYAPEEFLNFIDENVAKIEKRYNAEESRIKKVYEDLVSKLPKDVEQKDFALAVQKEVPKELNSHMFSLRAGRGVNSKSIWESIKPVYTKSFWSANNGRIGDE